MEQVQKHKSHPIDIVLYNEWLADKSPAYIVDWALGLARRPVVTSNFRPFAASLLHLCVSALPGIPVIWCDTGFNSQATYDHIYELKQRLRFQLHRYRPSLSDGFIRYYYGIPAPDSRLHPLFSELVKLEPFRRAFREHRPDMWFTNIRKGQTAHRDNLNILSYTRDGILKVSPFYHFSNKELYAYIQAHDLPIEFDYRDPTKGTENCECGIQLM